MRHLVITYIRTSLLSLGTILSTPLQEDENERSVSDFKYLENTFHLDDEDGLLYKVSRVGKSKGYIVAWRQLVLNDGTLDKTSGMLKIVPSILANPYLTIHLCYL